MEASRATAVQHGKACRDEKSCRCRAELNSACLNQNDPFNLAWHGSSKTFGTGLGRRKTPLTAKLDMTIHLFSNTKVDYQQAKKLRSYNVFLVAREIEVNDSKQITTRIVS